MLVAISEPMDSSPPVRSMLATLLLLTAVTAFAGGYYGLAGAHAVPKAWLAGSPFPDYTTPSLLLTVVVGGSLFVAGIAVLLRWAVARAFAGVASTVLLLWIVAEYTVIGQVSWLQPVTVLVGLVMFALAVILPSPAGSNGTSAGS